ncbi:MULTISPECIES: hypothetical protein [unclassified Lentimonas]|uniref:hypothetical protein n=1 Tax=unclassified Lentimonas TaxID=2630993 RepID=UPI0013214D80|nr:MULTISPECIES: hypothetical protein [unclassified Lentimonas]CAA6697565.1 Unannotated [Lentimonas sp. CC10]CAA6697581.1 Unannotated [Lentimonas sp. CC19]CAA7072433.1 Unannotated [Lentimonas sp. CC11]
MLHKDNTETKGAARLGTNRLKKPHTNQFTARMLRHYHIHYPTLTHLSEDRVRATAWNRPCGIINST